MAIEMNRVLSKSLRSLKAKMHTTYEKVDTLRKSEAAVNFYLNAFPPFSVDILDMKKRNLAFTTTTIYLISFLAALDLYWNIWFV